MNAAEWFRDLAQAADDLGYGIEAMSSGGVGGTTIVLAPRFGDSQDATLTLSSVLLSGNYLRRHLRPLAEPGEVEHASSED